MTKDSWTFKNTPEDIERVSKEIRNDLGLGECDCMKKQIGANKMSVIWDIDKSDLLYVQGLLIDHRDRQRKDGFTGKIPMRLIDDIDRLLS